MVSRRSFLRGLGTAGAAAVGAGVGVVGRAAADDDGADDHYAAQPDDVVLEFDRERLERYRPSIEVAHLDEQPNALYALVARDRADAGNPHGTDMLVYFADYDYQRGVSQYDSHLGDKEPIYVAVNKSDGSIRAVHYSGYHWLRATDATPSILDESAIDDSGNHVPFRAIKPWHHYTRVPDGGKLLDVRDLTAVYRDWLKTGLADEIEPGSVTNPWTMRTRESWWRSAEAAGFRINSQAQIYSIRLALGIDNAAQTDLSDGGPLSGFGGWF